MLARYTLALLLFCAGIAPGAGLAQMPSSGSLLSVAGEPDTAGGDSSSPTYRPSIPRQFLDASAPFDPSQAPAFSKVPISLVAAQGGAARPDVGLSEKSFISGSQSHYFPTIPDAMLAGSSEYVPGASYPDMMPPPPALPRVSAEPEIAPPQAANYFPSIPLDSPAAFPLYAPGSVPPGYPGLQTQFQQGMSGAPQAAMSDGFPGPSSAPYNPTLLERLRQRRANRPTAWSLGAEGLFLTEGSKPEGPALVQNVASGGILVSAPDLTGTWGSGTKLNLTRRRSDNVAYQFSYFGIYNWNRQYTTIQDNNLQLAGPIALATFDFFAADNMTINYRTTFHSLESNFIVTPNSPLGSFVFGSRYIYWTEQFDLQSTDFDTETSNYKVNTTNRMYGGQIGWNGAFDSAFGETTLKLRGGIFASHASQGQTLYDFDNTFELRNTGNTDNRVSYLGEASIMQSFNPMSGVDIRIGYTLMWIEGLARAPGNVDLSDNFDSGMGINNSSSVFLHGFSAGAAVGW